MSRRVTTGAETGAGWPRWFWLALIVAPILFLSLMHYLENRVSLPETWHVTQLEYLPSSSATPPPEGLMQEHAWQSVNTPAATLGDVLKPATGWFRIALPEEAEPKSWLLIIPSPINTSYSLWLSDVPFATTGSHAPAAGAMPRNPITMEFSNLALRGGDRHLYLRATRQIGGLYPNGLYLGPAEELRSYSEHITFVKESLIRAILMMMAIMAMVVFSLHLVRRRQTSIYGWYALGIAVWFVHTLHGQHENATFGSLWFWYRTSYVTLAAYVIVALVFINRLIDRPQPRVESALLLFFIAGSALILFDPLGWHGIQRFNTLFWIPAIIAGGLYLLTRLGLSVRRDPNPHTLLLLAATFLGICVGVRDYLYNDLQLIPGGMLYLRHSTGLVLVAFSFVMIRRFATSSQELPESTTGLLHAQSDLAPVSETTTGYQHSLLQQEHDDLEAQLQQAVLRMEPSDGTAQFNQFNSTIRAARHDLQLVREMIDRGDEAPPGELLERMQDRLERSAHRQRVGMSWETPLIKELSFIKGHFELALARFVQTATLEALSFETVQDVAVTVEHLTEPQLMQVRVIATVAAVDASSGSQSSRTYSKRAQMEAAARVLGGELNFSEPQTSNDNNKLDARVVELKWAADDAI